MNLGNKINIFATSKALHARSIFQRGSTNKNMEQKNIFHENPVELGALTVVLQFIKKQCNRCGHSINFFIDKEFNTYGNCRMAY
jgi:hypothetical protein